MATLQELLKDKLYGFDIKEDGNLLFWYWPKVGGPVKTRVEEVVPHVVVEKGADEIEAHVLNVVLRVQKMEREYFDERRRRIEAVHLDLTAEVDGVPLTGTLTHAKERGPLWMVTLLTPAEAATASGIYAPRYPSAAKKGEELITLEGEPSEYAIEGAKKMLARLYQDYIHKKMHRAAYAARDELERRSEAARTGRTGP